MFTEIDHQEFRNLRITHVATQFEKLISDEANDELTPEQIFLTAVDDALDQRQAHRIDKLIRVAKFPIPQASIAVVPITDPENSLWMDVIGPRGHTIPARRRATETRSAAGRTKTGLD